jgi:Transglutaminase-like superfamily
MKRFARFCRLSGPERTLLVQAAFLLALIRLALRVLPFATVRNLLDRLARTRSGLDDHASHDRIIWAVETAGRQFPGIGTCLTQALTTQVILARRGYSSNLRIGVTRDSAGKFIAHAWLEKDGVILIGGAAHHNYTPMPALNGLEP